MPLYVQADDISEHLSSPNDMMDQLKALVERANIAARNNPENEGRAIEEFHFNDWPEWIVGDETDGTSLLNFVSRSENIPCFTALVAGIFNRHGWDNRSDPQKAMLREQFVESTAFLSVSIALSNSSEADEIRYAVSAGMKMYLATFSHLERDAEIRRLQEIANESGQAVFESLKFDSNEWKCAADLDDQLPLGAKAEGCDGRV